MNTAIEVESPQLRSAQDSVAQDWTRLASYLATQGLSFDPEPAPRQFAGGFANLNYLVRIDGIKAVLRRPPMGPLPPGAYDMGRESKILSRLHEQFPLAPRALHLCPAANILGAPFQITEYRRGISIRDTLPPPFAGDAAVGRQLGATMIDVLSQLHRVNPVDAGLEDLGKPQRFLERAVEGWIKRSNLAVQGWATPRTLALIDELSAWMRTNSVPDGAAVLLHNDFKLDNILLDPATLAPVAVLDWDQGTRGDGLFDLATLLSYWTEPSDPDFMHQLQQMPTAQPGFPTRLEAAQAYAASTGRDLSGFRFHRVVAQFKTAIIFAQLYARWHAGATKEDRFALLGGLAEGLLEFALDISAGRRF
ncbi:MAG: aminoglycoside phosphotransferase [Hydrocarboniphaga sp.]|uniref:phosphotransferase family protein n=1 Tax=Hydrocarboniphaga sp. TaxID=2033016 RepID=UPI00261267E1|nr:phosphotransferase family protein [Hydrocarboniphaga sp.]MDB5967731.1 aminoglycoside phosphotransferase [Hydrocarboniphaga sp.]